MITRESRTPMENTPNLNLPYIAAAQAQKHVTHNEAIRALDAIVQIGVADRDLIEPPAGATDGDCYIVAGGGSGVWHGHDGEIAAWQDRAWMFYPPKVGWLAWVLDEQKLLAWDGAGWVSAGGGSAGYATTLGINANADVSNRLTVKSEASLFSHDDVLLGSGDHRIKVNKAAPENTSSQLFQSGFSGRAEFGLTGDDDFHVKVSPNGTDWYDSITVDKDTGSAVFGPGSLDPWFKFVSPQPPTTAYRNATVFEVRNNMAGASTRVTFAQQAVNRMLCEVSDQDNTKGNWLFQPYGGQISLGSWRNLSPKIVLGGDVAPDLNNSYSCGTAKLRWSEVYSVNGAINTSDIRDKTDIQPIGGIASALVDAIEPIFFKWKVAAQYDEQIGTQVVGADKNGQSIDQPIFKTRTRPGARRHAGFRAQDVQAAMDGLDIDFSAWGLDDKSDPESPQWVRPDELLPILWQAVRELSREVTRMNDVPPSSANLSCSDLEFQGADRSASVVGLDTDE